METCRELMLADMLSETIRGDVAQSVHEERVAMETYRRRAVFAQSHGDDLTALLFRHLADEEEHHKSELATRYNELLNELVKEKV